MGQGVNRWKAFFGLCWLRGHDHEQIVDCDARRAFNRCKACGHEFQYDFQEALPPYWIGFCDKAHSCPLCMGWKPKDWDRCANEICAMNPDGPLYRNSDGTVGPRLDSRP
jgi:hypothetical protein